MTGTRSYYEIEEFLESAGIRQEVRSSQFHILKVEDHINSLKKEMLPYRYHFFEITYTTGFDIDCRVNTGLFQQTRDNLLFVTPGQVNSWSIKTVHNRPKGYMMFFKPELLGASQLSCEVYKTFQFFNINTIPVYYLSEQLKPLFLDLFARIHDEYRNFREGSIEIITAYLLIFLQEAKRTLEPAFQDKEMISRADEITFKFENLIKAGLYQKKNVNEYARELFISPSYLRECVKKSTGKPAHYLIQEYTLLEAKSLLLQTSNSIKEVALQLGFEDSSNFVKFFKKQTETTPRVFREKPHILP